MKVLLSALHFAYLRNFESVVRELAERGHRVHLIADEPETFGGQALAERLAAEYPGVTWGWAPSPEDESWFPVAQKARFALDYVRFLHPRYRDTPKLRLRNIARAPRIVRWLTSGPGALVGMHRPMAAALRWFERRLPPSARTKVFLEQQDPDVVLLASLTVSRSFAMEQLKAARALGIPSAACVMSWDHLSSKAPIHIAPDSTLVWNEIQRREAIEMHGLRSETVVVTGAQCYDQWFGRQPARSREDFCQAVGLDGSRPFVLYVCSAMSPAPDPVEPHFVKQWVEVVRASGDPVLRDAGVLIRPHPERVREWQSVSLDGIDNVVVHGRTPIDGDAKADYFDSLYYSEAVVGLCTSAFLEAAIVGRPVLALRLPAYRIHQDGMAHFRYLLTVESGLLHTAPDLPAHLGQLSGTLRAGGGRDERNRRFVTAFVRPGGLDTAATPLFVDAVERLGGEGRKAPDPRFAERSPATRFVEHLAVAGTRGLGQWLLMDAFDLEKTARDAETAQERRRREAGRAARRAVEEGEREAVLRRTQEERARKTEQLRARERARDEQRLARQREGAHEAVRKQRARQWRHWRYRLGTNRSVTTLKRGLRRLSGVFGQ